MLGAWCLSSSCGHAESSFPPNFPFSSIFTASCLSSSVPSPTGTGKEQSRSHPQLDWGMDSGCARRGLNWTLGRISSEGCWSKHWKGLPREWWSVHPWKFGFVMRLTKDLVILKIFSKLNDFAILAKFCYLACMERNYNLHFRDGHAEAKEKQTIYSISHLKKCVGKRTWILMLWAKSYTPFNSI